ncbi:MAG: carbohydrate ABC transporter permease [Clostridia bacterium]|nr:carbohydrate ABC transporter permease [Clostridia bacterium]
MKYLKIQRQTPAMKAFIVVFLVFFAVCAFLHVLPLLWAISNSLKTGMEYFDDNMSLPKTWQFVNYLRVFTEFEIRGFDYFNMLFNSLWMLVVSVVANVFSSAILAYPIARYRFPGKEFLYSVVIFANVIPIIGSGAASFKMIDALGMVNNPATIWLSWAGGFDFAFIIFYGNFKGISMTYSEAAKIDGASDFRVFTQIILPQAFPCITAIAIQQSFGVWNNYSRSMIYLRDYPNLAYGLYLFNTEANYIEDSKPIYFAAAIISAIPVIVLYSCSQKLILTNVTAGGLKG